MSTGTTKSPALPFAPVEYNQQYMDQVLNILRLYFQTLDNPGPSAASTQYVNVRGGTQIVSAMNFSLVNSSGTRVVSLPTQSDLVNLKVGDIYYDTSANNVLKVKT
jgi:hypothetical protein